MNNFSLIVLASVAVVVSVTSTIVVQPKTLRNSILLSEPYEIISKQGKSLYRNLGKIAARNCGGAGRLLTYRSEGCTTSSVGGACLFPTGRQFRAELTFVPSVNTESLGVRTVVILPDGGKTAWENPYSSKDDSIQAGKEYALMTTGGVDPEIRGKMWTSQLQIYRESDKVIEACAEADFLFV